MYYFQWNKALYDYYFGSDTDSVVLYVDDDIIESIGREFDIPQLDGSYLKSFLSSTIIDPNDLSLIWYELFRNQGGIQESFVLKSDISTNEKAVFMSYLRTHPFRGANRDVNQLADYLLDVTNSNKKLLSCPLYLAFMITVILAAQHQSVGERAMHEAILNYWNGKNKFGFNARIPQTLARNFDRYTNCLNRFNNAFDASNARNQYIHIGKIRYHLMLSNNERDRIQELLYYHKLNRWDEEHIPYQKIINYYIMPHLGRTDGELRNILANSTMSADIVKNILRNYSYVKFQENHKIFQIGRITDSFYFILDIDDIPPTLSLGTMYTETGDNDQLILRGSEYGAEYGLYPVETKEPLRWGVDYRYISDNVSVRTLNYNQLAFFEQNPSSNVFIQVDENKIVPYRNYLVVVPNNRSFDPGKDVTKNYRDLFPRCTVKYVTDINQIPNIGCRDNGNHKTIDLPFEERPGIISPRYHKNYYYIGLKYYHIDNYQSTNIYEIACVDEDKNEAIQSTTHVTPAGDVFIDIPWDDTVTNRRCRFTLMENGAPISNGKVYNIVAELGRPDGEILNHFKFDGWGRHIPGEQQSEYYSNGNICTENTDTYSIVHRRLEEDWYDADDNDFLLLDLITTIGEDEPDWINDKTLSYVIQYVAAKKGFPELSSGKISVIKSALMELGYLDRAFDVHLQEIYQVNDLRIVPSTKQFKDGNDAFLLFGGCTRKKRRAVMNTIESLGLRDRVRFKLPYHNRQVQRMPYLSILPPFFLIDNQTSEQLSNHLGLEKKDLWNIDGFVNFINGIEDFDKEFTSNNVNPWSNEDRSRLNPSQLPRYVMDNDSRRLRLETLDGIYTHYYYNQRRIPIPSDLIKLYCQNSHDFPVIIVDEPECPEQPHYNKVYFAKEMGVPYLLKRLFCTLNLGLQQEEYAFFVDHYCETDPRKQWYTSIRSYDVSGISDSLLRTLIGKLSSRELNDDLTLNESIIVKERNPDYSMKLYRNPSNPAENYLCLYDGDTMLACSIPGDNDEVFLRNTDIDNPSDFGAFYRVVNIHKNELFVNDILSQIIRFDYRTYITYNKENIRKWIPVFPPISVQRLKQDFNESNITIVLRTNL